jgi:hypothetical protein
MDIAEKNSNWGGGGKKQTDWGWYFCLFVQLDVFVPKMT